MTNLVAKGPAERFGRYHVLGLMGDGSLGQLHVAEQSGADGFVEIVALRSLHPQLTESPSAKLVLSDTTRLAAMVKHANVASTDELEESDGRHFLASEYLPGENLASILASCASRAPMPIAMVAILAQQCAEGLRYAHDGLDFTGTAFGLVHGDIRPSNIFVTYHGVAKLLGYGAGALVSLVPAVRGSSRGGFGYTAPEALEGATPDARGDVFSMGTILWECLTGRPLFSADTAAKTKDAVRSRYVEPPSVIRADVPPSLDEVALRTLSRDPRRRYQNGKELFEALERVLIGLPRRPTAELVSEWLRQLFGAERATLKIQIAQGTAVEGALARLRLLGEVPPGDGAASRRESSQHGEARAAGEPTREPPPSVRLASSLPPPFRVSPTSLPAVHAPRTPPGTASIATPGVGTTRALGTGGSMPVISPALSTLPALSATPPTPQAARGSSPAMAVAPMVHAPAAAPTRPSRTTLLAAGGAVVAIVLALLIFRPSGGASPPQREGAAAVGAFQIQSTPAGAQILIDGDPSGLVTPASVNGLRAGRKVDVQVDKPGYRSTKQTVEVPLGGPRLLTFVLEESTGTMRLEGLPGHATVYVDESPVNGTQPLALPIGPHRLRVEVSGQLFSSMKIDVPPGKHTLRVQQTEGGGL